jgi:hypothetical protein
MRCTPPPQPIYKLSNFAGPNGKQQPLATLLARAQAGQQAAAAGSTDTPGGLQLRPLADALTDPEASSNRRSALLSPLQTKIMSDTEQHYMAAGVGRDFGATATDVVRAAKAWAKQGLPLVLAACARATPVMPGARTPRSLPPSFVWEVVVLHTLESAAPALAQLPRPFRSLALFMAVMEAAAARLRTSADGARPAPILVQRAYSLADAEGFRRQWGEGALCTPIILDPADPSHNCTIHCRFRDWDVLADGCRGVSAQLLAAVRGGGAAAGQQQEAAQQAESQAAPDAWQQLLDASTLGPAVSAFLA